MAERCAVCQSETCHDHCVYCSVDVHLFDHLRDCPSNTGLFPVRPIDLGQECVHCQQRTPGMVCAECGVPFVVGDFYAHQSTEHDDTGIVVCLGCHALKPVGSIYDD